MGLAWNEKAGRWEWEGTAKGLVDAVAGGDARLGFVLDKKSGVKVAMNISGTDDEYATEPLYVETASGDNLLDPSNRKEAVQMVERARRGQKEDLDMDAAPRKRLVQRKARSRRASPAVGLKGVR